MYNFPEMDMDAAALGGIASIVLVVMLVIVLIASVFGILSYILTSLGTYTIANRRGIKHAWLAWIPIGDAWIMGCISDQYQQVAKNKTTRRRIILLVLMIVTMVASSVSGAMSVVEMINMTMEGEYPTGMAMTSSLFSLVMSGVSIAYSVLYYFCLYDLYTSCKPENGVLYLVLTILIGVVTPFLIFSCRNKDQGMPTPQPQYQPPYQPYMPAGQPPVYDQPAAPTWQSVQHQPQQPNYQPQQPNYQPYQAPQYQPPVEPWEQNSEQ